MLTVFSIEKQKFPLGETFVFPKRNSYQLLSLRPSVATLPSIKDWFILYSVRPKNLADILLVFGREGSFLALKLIKLILTVCHQQTLLNAFRLQIRYLV